jgi:anti-anti-sigma factor
MTDAAGDRVPSEGEALLSLTTTQIGSALVVTAAGELDLLTAPALRTAIRAALDRPGIVVVDLSGVTFLSSAGLDVLVAANDTAAQTDQEAAGGWRARLRLVLGHERPVRRPMQIAGLDRALAIYDTVTDALVDDPTPPPV